ncbi:FecR domain-containing protein [Algoriphagus sp. AGSA1]|uniref:FecR family protein n=1 Tax=Algoriphagus sp. AGSA1 TaxID=2907213 RepID=UPI001F39EFC1|nr:FecR domain-containing protein [Algoriphagus sp. AGSA1]
MNKDKEQIDQILTKWLTNAASNEELELLKAWACQSEENLELMETFQKVWREKNPEPILVNVDEKSNEIWEKAMLSGSRKKLNWQRILKYAAAIVILISSTIWLYYSSQNFSNEPETAVSVSPIYILKENIAGQKTKIFLPDGSVVYLNSNSKLKYSSNFSGDERRVYMKGEAYFEVAKDSLKPFVVESDQVETVALGTAFNVNSFDANEIRISLTEGSVRINQKQNEDNATILSPGKELVVNTETQTFSELSFNQEDVIGWKEGKLVFRQATLDEVSSSLERWYGVEIQIRGRVPKNWKVTTVYENETLKNVLTDLQYSKKFAYEINNSNVVITF